MEPASSESEPLQYRSGIRKMISLKNYEGREQAFVKHLLLEEYLKSLVHKTASVYNNIVYVDGFAGPWQSGAEDYKDTSFGIALNVLTEAKVSWNALGRKVQMTALLVERNRKSYEQLAVIGERFPQVVVKTYNGDFIEKLPILLRDIPPAAFTFFLIDPKGWKIPIEKIKPLLTWGSSEVLFNFMFDFINRFAVHDDPAVVEALKNLMPFGDWRERLIAAVREGLSPEERKAILVNAFSENLRRLGQYKYVCETPVFRPERDRPLYSLFYATRHDTGLDVFRSCQVKTFAAQSKSRAQTKLKHREERSGQGEMFGSAHEMTPDREALPFLEAEQRAAEDTLMALVTKAERSLLYRELWPQVLAERVVTKTDVNAIAAKLRKDGRLRFPNWESRQRVPRDDTVVQLP
jgi:three-Cys-motif partner protein